MPSLTLKDMPVKLHARLKQRARHNRRSLNQEVLFCLEHVTDLVKSRDTERTEWLAASASSLERIWDNKQDDIYNELLEK